MKVLLLADHGSPVGGAEVMTRTLRDGLRQRGHDTRLLASCAVSHQAPSFADYECFGTTARSRTLLQAFNPWAFAQLRRILREFRPDVVHVRMFLTQLSPSILPLLRDVPSLYHASWYRSVCPLASKLLPDGSPCQTPAGRACYRHRCLPLHRWAPFMLQRNLWSRWRDAFDLVVANSHACRSHLVADGVESVEVVWNGVPVTAERSALRDRPTAAYAGRLVPMKGVDVLLRAFSRVALEIPDAQLLVAGDGPDRAALGHLAARLGILSRVAFLGHLARPELERRFAGAWVQAVPSTFESFGLVAAEAAMRGTAVVASRTGGLPELIRHGETGLLIAPASEAELAHALGRILRDPALADRMGKSARAHALQHFSAAACVSRFAALYESICRSGAGQPAARSASPESG